MSVVTHFNAKAIFRKESDFMNHVESGRRESASVDKEVCVLVCSGG